MIKLKLQLSEKMEKHIYLYLILLLIAFLIIGFGLCALCTYVACMCFGFNWSIQFAAGVFFLMVMLWWFVRK